MTECAELVTPAILAEVKTDIDTLRELVENSGDAIRIKEALGSTRALRVQDRRVDVRRRRRRLIAKRD